MGCSGSLLKAYEVEMRCCNVFAVLKAGALSSPIPFHDPHPHNPSYEDETILSKHGSISEVENFSLIGLILTIYYDCFQFDS